MPYKNKEDKLACQRRCYARNADKVKAKVRQYKKRNARKVSAYNKAYGQRNRKILTAKSMAWKKANPLKVKEIAARYREKNRVSIMAKWRAYYDKYYRKPRLRREKKQIESAATYARNKALKADQAMSIRRDRARFKAEVELIAIQEFIANVGSSN